MPASPAAVHCQYLFHLTKPVQLLHLTDLVGLLHLTDRVHLLLLLHHHLQVRAESKAVKLLVESSFSLMHHTTSHYITVIPS